MLVAAEDAENLLRLFVLIASHRAGVIAAERDNFAAGVSVAFARDHRGAHVVNPDAAVFLPDVIVADETNPAERLAHDFAAELLLNETALERPRVFRGA